MQTKIIENVLIDYFAEIVRQVKRTAARGQGRKILGGVINRPEDLEIGVDQLGEEILEQLLRKHNLCAAVFSEPEKREIKSGPCKAASIYGSIDPFDGSILFLKGFKQNWYSALSFYSRDRKPLATAIVDILNEKAYLLSENGNYVLSSGGSKKNKITPSQRKTLRGAFVLASYIMSSQYFKKFFDVFSDLLRNMHPKALLYPYGGSFIYGFLAAGLVDAYVMFNEPRSEIDPGFPIAKKAGCEIVSVMPDGSCEDYEFVPGQQHDKVDLLIAACTRQLRDELIRYYLRHQRLSLRGGQAQQRPTKQSLSNDKPGETN